MAVFFYILNKLINLTGLHLSAIILMQLPLILMVINIILNKLMWLVCTCLLAPIRYHLNTTTTDINSNKKYFEQSNVTGLHLPTITFLIQLLLIWTAINYLEQANVTGMHLPAITLIQQPLILMSIKIILNKLMWLACTYLLSPWYNNHWN